MGDGGFRYPEIWPLKYSFSEKLNMHVYYIIGVEFEKLSMRGAKYWSVNEPDPLHFESETL